MPAAKGTRPPNAGKGRKKGSHNKIPAALKDMILQALANKGGVAYLEEQAKANPVAFLSLVGKVLPLQVQPGGADPVVPEPVHHHYHPPGCACPQCEAARKK